MTATITETETSSSVQAGKLYKARLSYDGGPIEATVAVDLFDASGTRVARLSGSIASVGKGEVATSGWVMLNYPPRDIKDWGSTCTFESNYGGICMIYTGLTFESVARAVFDAIPARGNSVGRGSITVP